MTIQALIYQWIQPHITIVAINLYKSLPVSLDLNKNFFAIKSST